MAKQEEALFEESSQGAVSAITATILVVSVALMVGGLVLMGYAFHQDIEASPATWMFVVGLLATVLGFAIPFNLLPSSGK